MFLCVFMCSVPTQDGMWPCCAYVMILWPPSDLQQSALFMEPVVIVNALHLCPCFCFLFLHLKWISYSWHMIVSSPCFRWYVFTSDIHDSCWCIRVYTASLFPSVYSAITRQTQVEWIPNVNTLPLCKKRRLTIVIVISRAPSDILIWISLTPEMADVIL